MADSLRYLVDSIVAATPGLPDPDTLASWSPEISGDLPLVIRSDGSWWHEGTRIQREGLVRLFASLLRREGDGKHYLVTPAEKWRVEVERHALLGIDCDVTGSNGSSVWYVLLNTGGRCRIGGENQLHGEGEHGEPYVELPNGLTAQITRAAWYRLINAATIDGDRVYITSQGRNVDLGSAG